MVITLAISQITVCPTERVGKSAVLQDTLQDWRIRMPDLFISYMQLETKATIIIYTL